MSKTLTGILETVAGAVLEFVPGGQAIGTSLLLAGTASLASGLFSSTSKPEQSETAIKSPTPIRVSAYGASKLAIAYVLYETNAKGVAVDVGAIHDGRIDGPIAFYLGDANVASTHGVVGGTGDGAYSRGAVEIDFRLGLPSETAYSQVTALLPNAWNANHRGDGVCTAMVTWQPIKQKDYLTVYPNGQPPLSMAARWQPVFDWRDGSQSATDPATWKWSENAILHLAHYLLVRDNKDWATHFAPTLAYWTHAADVADQQVPLASAQTRVVVPAKAGDHSVTVDRQAAGLAAGGTITLDVSGNTQQTETRTITGVSAGGGGIVVSLSAALSYAHPYLSQARYNGAGLTEARYRGCVAHKHSDAHKDVVASLLACADAFMMPRSDGALIVYAGEYVVPDPADTIGPDQIVSYSIQDGVDEENAVNQITLTYVSNNHDYATVDTDPWEDTDDQVMRGKVLATQLANQVPSYTQARRLAKASLARTMAPKRGTVTVNSRGRQIRGKRYVPLLIVETGTVFLDAVVEITKLTRNMGTFGYTAEWVLADPNAYAWNAATESGNAAPIGNSVAGEPLEAPIVVSVTPSYGQDAAFGAPGVRLNIVAQAPMRDDLTWYVRIRPVGDVSWLEQSYPDEDAGPSVTLQTNFVPLAMLEAEVAYRTGDGRQSPWGSPESAVDASGTAPSAVTGLSVSANSDGTLIVADWADTPFATSYQVEIIVGGS